MMVEIMVVEWIQNKFIDELRFKVETSRKRVGCSNGYHYDDQNENFSETYSNID